MNINDILDNIILGDSLEILKQLPDSFIDCVVTSPPYWALRDYGIENQLGLEKTFQEYINKLCNIFDEIKRVLKDSGTCFVNLGDTYGGSGKGSGGDGLNNKETWRFEVKPEINDNKYLKHLLQIPSRFAIEMANRGWILRNEIIWFKNNNMPQSAKDRFTVDFEKIFFFVKNKKYYFETQYEKLNSNSIKDINNRNEFCNKGKSNVYSIRSNELRDRRDFCNLELGRIKRCVWKINTYPLGEAHFASYPEELIFPMIKAGCPKNGIVLDPFFGSGTTGIVAKKQSKHFIGIELNPQYIEIAKKRLNVFSTNLKLNNNNIFELMEY